MIGWYITAGGTQVMVSLMGHVYSLMMKLFF